jgi:hypothetical protein
MRSTQAIVGGMLPETIRRSRALILIKEVFHQLAELVNLCLNNRCTPLLWTSWSPCRCIIATHRASRPDEAKGHDPPAQTGPNASLLRRRRTIEGALRKAPPRIVVMLAPLSPDVAASTTASSSSSRALIAVLLCTETLAKHAATALCRRQDGRRHRRRRQCRQWPGNRDWGAARLGYEVLIYSINLREDEMKALTAIQACLYNLKKVLTL